MAAKSAALKIVSSTARAPERDSIARAIVPATFLKAFAQAAARSLTVETTASDNVETAIRIGNTGVAENFAKLAAACGTTASAAHP